MPRSDLPMPGFSRADLHVHTTYSDGTASPEDVLNYYALHSSARVFAITDHDTLDGAREAQRFAAEHPDLFGHLELIIGEEVTSRDGHILGLFLDEWVPPGMDAAATVAAIHAQGGIAIAAHPYTGLMKWNGLVGVGDLIKTVPFDAVETRNSNFTEVFANRKAERNAGKRARVGCSDGHFLDAVGRCYTDFPGTTAEDLRRAIHERTTIPGGGCYGAITLFRYVVDRLRSGGSLFPNRDGLKRPASGGELAIQVHAESGLDATLLTLEGSLDATTMKELKQTVDLATRAKVGVVLDLSRVTFLDSTGITALVGGLKNARKNGVGFCLANPSVVCRRTLDIVRLGDVIPIASDLETARREVAARAPVDRAA